MSILYCVNVGIKRTLVVISCFDEVVATSVDDLVALFHPFPYKKIGFGVGAVAIILDSSVDIEDSVFVV